MHFTRSIFPFAIDFLAVPSSDRLCCVIAERRRWGRCPLRRYWPVLLERLGQDVRVLRGWRSTPIFRPLATSCPKSKLKKAERWTSLCFETFLVVLCFKPLISRAFSILIQKGRDAVQPSALAQTPESELRD